MIARVTEIEAADSSQIAAAAGPDGPRGDRTTQRRAPPAATAAVIEDELPEHRYLNRELSWLDFNARVLALAADTSLPLLERAKFLAIFASNLDEFYMVRVAGLKRRDEMGLSVRSADGLTPREQLRRIGEQTQHIATRHARVFLDSVRPGLAEEGIHIVTWADVDQAERDRAVDVLQRAGVPRPDSAGRRSGSPVPVRQRLEPESRGHRQAARGRRPALRPSQGARQRRSLR